MGRWPLSLEGLRKQCVRRVKFGVAVINNLCPWGDDTEGYSKAGGDIGGSEGADESGGEWEPEWDRKTVVWRKAWLPAKIFATLPPGGREEVCTLAFALLWKRPLEEAAPNKQGCLVCMSFCVNSTFQLFYLIFTVEGCPRLTTGFFFRFLGFIF